MLSLICNKGILSESGKIMTNKKDEQILLKELFGIETTTDSVPVATWESALRYMENIYHSTEEHKHNILVLKHPTHLPPEHMHGYFEMLYILSGVETHLINHQPKRFHTGDLYILPPLAQHSLPENESNNITIMIHPDAFENIFSGILHGQDCLGDFLMNSIYRNDSETYLLFHTGHNEELQNIMRRMLDLMANADGYTDRVLTGMLVLLFTSLSRTHHDALQTAPGNDRDNEILTLIYEQYDTITLSALAERLHYTVPYCSKYLKNHLGCNFSELLRKIRFQKAESYLMNSDMTVSQISQTLGYENPGNFMRAFKHQYRMTPSQYRITQMSPCAKIPPPPIIFRGGFLWISFFKNSLSFSIFSIYNQIIILS